MKSCSQHDGANGFRHIRLNTQKGKVEIKGAAHRRPGICPHCQKPIPANEITFQRKPNRI